MYWLSKGVPLLPLYTRGAGLHDGVLVGLQGRSPSRLQLYLLCLRKVGFYPYSARSFLVSCAASSPYVSLSGWPYWATVWIPGVTSSTLGSFHQEPDFIPCEVVHLFLHCNHPI